MTLIIKDCSFGLEPKICTMKNETKNDENLLRMISFPKFYSIDEAIAIANSKGKSFWREIVGLRKDVPRETLVEICTKHNLVSTYLCRKDVSVIEKIKLAKEVGAPDDKYLLLAPELDLYTLTYSIPAILSLAEELDVPFVWAFVLEEKYSTSSFAITKARELNNRLVWEELLLRPDIRIATKFELMKDLDDGLMGVLCEREEAKHFLNNDIEVKDIVSYGKVMNSKYVWAILLARKDFSVLEAKALANEIKDNCVWTSVISREDYDLEDAISIATLLDDDEVWYDFFQRNDIPILRKLKLGVGRPRIPSVFQIVSTKQAEVEIGKLSPEQITEYIDGNDYCDNIYRTVCLAYAREARVENAIKLAFKVARWSPRGNAIDMWKIILHNPLLSYENALIYVDKYKLDPIGCYGAIFDRPEFPARKMVELCKVYPALLDCAITKDSFKKYISSPD